MRSLFKATYVMGAATFVTMIIGLFRAKLTAIFLGPHGMGIFAQATTFFQSVETICGLSIGIGITKFLAQSLSEKNYVRIKNIIITSVMLQSAVFIFVFVAAIFFSHQISMFLFGTGAYGWAVVLITFSIFFSSLILTFESVLLGLGKVKEFSTSRVIYSIAGLITLAIFITQFSLNGAIVFLLVSSIFGISTVICFVRLILPAIKGQCAKFQSYEIKVKDISKELISYGAVTLISSTMTWYALLIVRSMIVKNMGVEANGFYQVIFAITSYYTPFFTNGLWGYLFPKLSGISDTQFYNLELNKALRFIFIYFVPFASVLYILKYWVVIAIFSEQFRPAVALFDVYMLGSFFYILSYVFGASLLAKKKLNVYLAIGLLQNILFLACFVLFSKTAGLKAIAYAYFIMNFAGALLLISWHIVRIGFVVNAGNIKLLVFGVIFLCLIVFSGDTVLLTISKISLLLVWFAANLRKRELALFRSFVKA